MSSPTKEKQNGVVHFFLHPGSESVVSFRSKISGILVLLIFSIGVSLQAQTINLDSLLTRDELSWLKANKDNIRYAPDPSWPPADYVEDGVHKGFVSDYIRLFEQMLACKFEKVYYPTWAAVLDGLENGETDFVGGIQKTVPRQEYLLFTEPFLRSELGIITQADYAPEVDNKQINTMKLACIKEYASTHYIEQEFPNASIIYVNNDYEALLEVVYGIADGAVVDYMTASYLAQKHGITHLKHAAFLDYYWNLSFASRQDLPEFNSILNKLLKQVDDEQHQAMVKKWVNYDILNEHRHGFYEDNKQMIIGIFLFVLLAFIVVGIFSLFLRQQVNRQTLALREAWDKAKKNEEKYKLLAENTSDVIWLSDLELNLSYVSPSIEKMVGFTPEEFSMLPLEKRVPQHHVGSLMNLLQQELQLEQQQPGQDKNRSRDIELEHFRKDGSTNWIYMTVTFVRDERGKPVGLHGITRDISERKKIRDYIDKRLAIETLLSRTSRSAVGNFSPETVFNSILKDIGSTLNLCRAYIFEQDNENQTISNSYEWCAENVPCHKDKQQKIPCKEISWMIEHLKQGNTIQFKDIEDIPDEKTKQILRLYGILSVLNMPLMIEDRFYGFIGFNDCKIHRDWLPENVKTLESLSYIVSSMLERGKTEKELLIKELSIEMSLVGKVFANLEGKIIYANRTFLAYWGYTKLEEILNKEAVEFLVDESDLKKIITAVMEKGEWEGESEARRTDGSIFNVLINANLVTNKVGEPLCMQASVFDITERKAWEKQLILAKEKAEENNRLKTAFLSNISHEIRTPMNGILGFLNLLNNTELSESEKEEYLHLVHKSGKRLIETLDDIIEISRIESGELEIKENETDINETIQFIKELYKPLALEKNLQFRINKNPESSALRFITDSYRLHSILGNLIKNAIKYTDKGSIELGAHIEEDHVRFFVKDTGKGIPADRIEAIFDRFVQADLNLSREHEGAGLGLSIARAYVEQLGGKILVKSKEKEGSTFSFTIPYKSPA